MSVPTNPGHDLRRAEWLVQAGKYPEAAELYRAFLKRSPDATEAAEAQYRLASVLSFYLNPERDFAASLREYQKLVAEHPGSPHRQTSENMASLLSILLAQKESLLTDQAEVKKLKETLSAEDAEIKQLKENLRKLQELEIEIEQKRTKDSVGPGPPESDR
jgi:tetratricopeptide (TPR) repeat protein